MSIKRKQKSLDELLEERKQIGKMWNLFLEIWNERPHKSEVSGKWLGKEPSSIFFDHCLEKSAYPQFKYEKENIILVTADEHVERSNGWPSEKHQEFINKAREKFLYAEPDKD